MCRGSCTLAKPNIAVAWAVSVEEEESRWKADLVILVTTEVASTIVLKARLS